jgi:hypothetical protein
VAAPPLDSLCERPVTYPGDSKILIKSSKGRSGPTLNKFPYFLNIYHEFLGFFFYMYSHMGMQVVEKVNLACN